LAAGVLLVLEDDDEVDLESDLAGVDDDEEEEVDSLDLAEPEVAVAPVVLPERLSVR
jgi:hypothetical protein